MPCSRVGRHAFDQELCSSRYAGLKPDAATPEERQVALVRALKRYRSRLDRKLQAMRGDLAEAERAQLEMILLWKNLIKRIQPPKKSVIPASAKAETELFLSSMRCGMKIRMRKFIGLFRRD